VLLVYDPRARPSDVGSFLLPWKRQVRGNWQSPLVCPLCEAGTIGADVSTDIRSNIGADFGANASSNIGAHVNTNVDADICSNIGADFGANASTNIGADVSTNVDADICPNVGTGIGANASTDIAADVGTINGVDIDYNDNYVPSVGLLLHLAGMFLVRWRQLHGRHQQMPWRHPRGRCVCVSTSRVAHDGNG